MAQRTPYESPNFNHHFTLEELIAAQGVQPVEGEVLDTMKTLSNSLWPTLSVAKEFSDFIQDLRGQTVNPQGI